MKYQVIFLSLLSLHCSAPAGEETSTEAPVAEGSSTGGSRGSVFSEGNGSGGAGDASGGTDNSGTDSSGTGGGTPSGFSCADPAVLVCDDLEAHTAGEDPAAPFKVVLDPYSATDSYVEVSGDRAHSGSLSIKVSGGGGYTNRALVAVPGIFPVANNHFFVRFWAYFESEFGTINDGQHMTYAFATGPFEIGTPGDEIRAGVHGNILNLNFRGGPTLGDPQLKAYTDNGKNQVGIEPIVQEWVCTEIEFDGEHDIINFWRNGEEITELHSGAEEAVELGLPTPTWSPKYADFRIGWQSYGGKSMVAYYDDIVISTQAIGCSGP